MQIQAVGLRWAGDLREPVVAKAKVIGERRERRQTGLHERFHHHRKFIMRRFLYVIGEELSRISHEKAIILRLLIFGGSLGPEQLLVGLIHRVSRALPHINGERRSVVHNKNGISLRLRVVWLMKVVFSSLQAIDSGAEAKNVVEGAVLHH